MLNEEAVSETAQNTNNVQNIEDDNLSTMSKNTTPDSEASTVAIESSKNSRFIVEQLMLFDNFSGKDDVNIVDYLERFEEVANYLEWTESDKVFVLRSKLTGEAANILKDRKIESKNLASLVELLKDKYAPKKSTAQKLQTFLSFKQTLNMSVDTFFSRLEELSENIVDEDDNEEIAKSLKLRLMKSTAISNLRPELKRGVVIKSSKTYDEVKSFARVEEKGWLAIRQNDNEETVTVQALSSSEQKDGFSLLKTKCEMLEKTIKENDIEFKQMRETNIIKLQNRKLKLLIVVLSSLIQIV